jgi:hypothetical protein
MLKKIKLFFLQLTRVLKIYFTMHSIGPSVLKHFIQRYKEHAPLCIGNTIQHTPRSPLVSRYI